jgi:hypothetical protein
MFNVSSINKRYFGLKLTVTDDEGKEHSIQLEVEPPKLKTMKRLVAMGKTASEDSMDELADTIHDILNKNKSGTKVPDEYIDELDFDELIGIMTAYFEWLNQSKNDPN